MNKLSTLKKSLAALGAATLLAGTASATPVVGLANLTFGQVSVSLNEIDWNPPLNPGLDAVRTYGSFSTFDGANTGSFAVGPMVGITSGKVQDMSNNPADANYMPVGPQVPPVPGFLQFTAQPGWLFTATSVANGDQGPFSLTQVGNNVSATISVDGTICDTEGDNVCDPTDDVTLFTGIFSAQYTNKTVAGIIAELIGGGTLQNNTWSGTIEATVPEPGSIALVGLALAGMGLALRRKSA